MKLLAMISLGCPKNLVDGETMLGALASAGFVITSSLEDAEVIIINTCAFIEPAVKESLEEIRRCAELKEKGRCSKLIVMGCLTGRYGEQIRRLLPEVDAWFGVAAVGELLAYFGKSDTDFCSVPPPRLLTTRPATAYLKVAEGCSSACSYCLIPRIRGPLRSRTPEDLLQEARSLVAGGVRELILVAQDTAAYGKDLFGVPSLHLLLPELAAIPGLRWIRLLYLNPFSITPELISAIQQQDKVCRYLDIPFQHASRRVLRKMGRRGDAAAYLQLLDQLRSSLPELVIRTTLMTGFPAEREEDFEELCDFVEKASFDRMGAFPYYHEEGARSSRMPDRVPFFEKRRRKRIIMDLQRGISREKNRKLVGKDLSVLVEQHLGDGIYLGRSYREAPEIDSKIIIRGDALSVGSFARVRLTEGYTYDLVGKAL